MSEAARVCHRGAATPSPHLLRRFVLLGSPLFGHRLVAWLPNSHVRCLLCLVFGSYFRFRAHAAVVSFRKKKNAQVICFSFVVGRTNFSVW